MSNGDIRTETLVLVLGAGALVVGVLALKGQPGNGTLPDGTLIKTANSFIVYIMDGGAKRFIYGPGAVATCGYDLRRAFILPEVFIEALPSGPAVVGQPCPVQR